MIDAQATGRPWHLWAVGAVSALWNCGGAYDYTMTRIDKANHLAGFTPEQVAWIDAFPLWANTAWALGVWGALGGSLLLLFASRWAVHAFAVSLLGLAGVTLFQFTTDKPAGMGDGAADMAFTAALWIVAALLLWYAMRMRAKGVLR